MIELTDKELRQALELAEYRAKCIRKEIKTKNPWGNRISSPPTIPTPKGYYDGEKYPKGKIMRLLVEVVGVNEVRYKNHYGNTASIRTKVADLQP